VRIANYGVQGASILQPSQQEAAANAFTALESYKVSLNEVIGEWISRKKAAQASISYEAAMDDFLAYRRRSASYAHSIRQMRNRLASLHGQLLNEITPASLARAMDRMTPSVRNFTIRILRGLFNFAIRRGYCTVNPVSRLDRAQREPTEIQIYTVQEVVDLGCGRGVARAHSISRHFFLLWAAPC
jgi:site-specific recombinase XerD